MLNWFLGVQIRTWLNNCEKCLPDDLLESNNPARWMTGGTGNLHDGSVRFGRFGPRYGSDHGVGKKWHGLG